MSKEYSGVELPALQRRQALLMFRRQLAKWKLKMPKVKPLVLDFGLRNFAKIGLIEFWVANETKAGYCGKLLFVFDRQKCPYHHHNKKHETFLVVKGRVRMEINGKIRVLEEGERMVMPTGVKHSFEGKGPALLLEISQPCLTQDNIFRNKQIGNKGII